MPNSCTLQPVGAASGTRYPATLVPRMLRAPRASTSGPRILSTARGSQLGALGPVDWALLSGVAVVWGSSYLLIEIGLDSLEPAVVTWVRVTLGFLALIGFPAARRPTEREDWRQTAVLALVWTTVPFLLSPISQQHIDSALAGMINALIPIFVASIAMVFLREVAGLLLGMVGAVSLALPTASESSAAAWGSCWPWWWRSSTVWGSP